MSLTWALALGFGLGLRHAADADHLVALVALLQRDPTLLRAMRTAALWGAGHSLSFLSAGALIVLTGMRVPAAFEPATQLAVSAMLIALGALHLWRSGPGRGEQPAPGGARALLVGLVHGLAGSAGIALLALTALGSPEGALSYLLLFGVGTVAGMVGLTLVLARPLAWTHRSARARHLVGALAGGLNVCLGLLVAAEALRATLSL